MAREKKKSAEKFAVTLESTPVTVTLKSTTVNGKVYGAGACTVWLGGTPIDAIALKCGDEHHVTAPGWAYDWLTRRGLDHATTISLLSEVEKER